MRIIDIFNGCLDAGDLPGAAAAVLAHPASQGLDRPAVTKLFQIAFCNAPAGKADFAMIDLMGTIIDIAERSAE
jgi:hypothetical protein